MLCLKLGLNDSFWKICFYKLKKSLATFLQLVFKLMVEVGCKLVIELLLNVL